MEEGSKTKLESSPEKKLFFLKREEKERRVKTKKQEAERECLHGYASSLDVASIKRRAGKGRRVVMAGFHGVPTASRMLSAGLLSVKDTGV